MFIKIDPLDTLFFRDGRPFTMGEDDWIESLFPPSPGVLYGALRSLYFAHHPNELPMALRENDPTAGLSLKLIYWLVGNQEKNQRVYFPLPLECVKAKEIKEKKGFPYRLRVLHQPKDTAISCPLPWILRHEEEEEIEAPENCLLDEDALAEYLSGEREEFSALELNDYVLSEPKVGIGRNPYTLTAEKHKLYRFQLSRLKELSLGVEYKGLELPEKGLMRLGGEGKGVVYHHLEGKTFSRPPLPEKESSKYFKLYLITPAFFAQGWLPGWLKENGQNKIWIGEYKGLQLQLLAAAIGKPQSIGGFNMHHDKKGPKEMRRAVPAGSIYYFELLKGDLKEVEQCFHGQSISEFRPQEGFGIAFVGLLSKKSLAALKAGD